ncbi:hypothetical protein B0H17DRAFT_1200401 [Mycena rosella]|uniref:Uncharacterized protein n=1 Tax=Mycena rosella TaxID=1033263 RepID=A0AAD7DJ61_MYCRO|nr:hypothetical protein B0H17DRAFT_1200401 [Mycena rosella]
MTLLKILYPAAATSATYLYLCLTCAAFRVLNPGPSYPLWILALFLEGADEMNVDGRNLVSSEEAK